MNEHEFMFRLIVFAKNNEQNLENQISLTEKSFDTSNSPEVSNYLQDLSSHCLPTINSLNSTNIVSGLSLSEQ